MEGSAQGCGSQGWRVHPVAGEDGGENGLAHRAQRFACPCAGDAAQIGAVFRLEQRNRERRWQPVRLLKGAQRDEYAVGAVDA